MFFGSYFCKVAWAVILPLETPKARKWTYNTNIVLPLWTPFTVHAFAQNLIRELKLPYSVKRR